MVGLLGKNMIHIYAREKTADNDQFWALAPAVYAAERTPPPGRPVARTTAKAY